MNQREPARLRLHTNSRTAIASVFVGTSVLPKIPSASQNRHALRWLAILWLGYAMCASSGCSVWRETNRVYDLARRTTQVEPHYYEYIQSDKVAQREARLLAKQAWAENPMNGTSSPDFKNGFHEGFADFLYRGGSGEPPVIPPRGYWNLRFLNQFGRVSVNDWYEGFRAGAADCKARGLRDMWLIPTSLVADEPTPSAPVENGVWLDDETWDEETYRQRVEEREQEKARLEALRQAEESEAADEDSADESMDSDDSESNDAVDALSGDDSDEESENDLGIDLGPSLDMVPDLDETELDANDDRGAFDLGPADDNSEVEEDEAGDDQELLIDDLFESTSNQTQPADSGSGSGSPALELPTDQTPSDDETPSEFPFDGGSDSTEIDFDDLQSRSNRRNSTDNQLAFRTDSRSSNRNRTIQSRSQGIRNQPRRDSAVRQASGVQRSTSATTRNPVRKDAGRSQAKSRTTSNRSSLASALSQKTSSGRTRSNKSVVRSSKNASLMFFEPEEEQVQQALDFSEPLPNLPLQLESTDVIYWDPVTGEQTSQPHNQLEQRRTNAAQLRARQRQTEQARAKPPKVIKSTQVVERKSKSSSYASQQSNRKTRKEIDPADLVFDSDAPSDDEHLDVDVRPLPPRTGHDQQMPSKFANWDPMEGVEEHGFADLDRSKYKSVLTNDTLEKTTRWTPEMARSVELPERVAETGTRMSPKRSRMQSVDRPAFQDADGVQDGNLRQQLNVALRDKSIQYRRSQSPAASELNGQAMAPVVDISRQPGNRGMQSTYLTADQSDSIQTSPRFYRAGDNDLPMVVDRESLPSAVSQSTRAIQLRLRD